MRSSLEVFCVEVSLSLALQRVRPHTGTGILWHTEILFLSYIPELQQRDFHSDADGSEMQHREQFTFPSSSLLCGSKYLGDLFLYSKVV